MNKKLSADPNALIFAIISLVIVLLGCCCGLFIVVGLILSVVGLVLANKSLRDYNNSPEEYSVNSKNNVVIAKILSIIALVLSSVALIIAVICFTIYGTLLSGEVMRNLYKSSEQLNQIQDSLRTIDYDSISEENSFYIDTVKVESETE